MKLYYIHYLLIVLFLSACQKGENPYVSRSVVDSLIARQNPDVKNVAFIFKNDVYYLPAFTKAAVRITNTPNDYKKIISMSHNFQKFAYLNANNHIVIVNSQGVELTQLTQYTNVRSFDWSTDDKTLYILNSNKMEYYGPSLNLPEITYPGINYATTPQVLSASVSSAGDFAYVFYAYYPFGKDYYKLVIKRADGGQDIVYQDEYQDEMGYVAFSTNEQDLVVGFKERTSNNNKLLKLAIFTGLQNYPDYVIDESSSQAYSTPKYSSKLNYMVGGYMENESDSLKLHAFGFEKFVEKDRELSEYFSKGDAIYTDWK